MAHPNEKRAQLRGLYIFHRMPIETACMKVKVPPSTANRWKREARDAGDDWDSLRTASALGDENFTNLGKQLLEEYLVQHQATMDVLKQDKKLTALQRAEILASMSDAFNKTMNSFRRLAPELNRQAVGLDVLKRLADFTRAKHPKHLQALIEIMEPFGEELAKAYA